ncbi:Amino Acid/Auxin Permease (AAAP) Family [Phytophthora cinnamomi]|uniref:Amino Acid/Auxin Permease (AAAP) Family n=1 Tax=Phytophthora cinnamomi TaxID=4785 RepID=UPI0035599F12|nr:Amino Acid/Auxin Permease (AAAP) Family [Phytophthora cinnamomi]
MAWAAALLSLLALTLRAVSADELNPDYRPGDTWVDGLLRYRITDADAIASTAVGLPAELMAASQPVFCTEKNMYTLSLTISLCLPSTEYTKLATLSLTSISNARQVAVQYTYLACSSAVGAPTTVTPITGPPSMEVMLGRTTPTVAGAVAVRVCPNLDCAVLPTDLVFATLPTASLIVPTSLTNLVDCAPTLANGVSYQEGQSGACKQMWTENSPTPRTNAETHMCAYPGSDFVMMTFAYDSDADATHDPDTVKGRYTDVKCYVRLAEGGPGNVDKVKEAALPLTWPTSTSGRIEISKQLALELVYDPETSETTDVKVSCDFTYEYFNSEQTDIESCNYPFTLKDCDAPELHTSDTAECALGSPIEVPGPFEACNGNVFTTVSGASQPETTLKAVNDACCASSPVLNCVSLTESAATGGVKRCEATTRLMMATELRVNDEDEDDGDTKLTASASPSAAELLVASAMAAIVALVAVKHRMAGASRQASEVDDVYVNLLD